jgi:NitT/TauT family transport system substrate-binding protein
VGHGLSGTQQENLPVQKIRRLVACLALLAAVPLPLPAQGLQKVRLAATHVFTYAPLLIARELGYYRAEGLDVDILETQSGTATASALLGGSVAAGGSGYGQPLLLSEQGKSVKSLVGLEMASIYVFVVANRLDVPLDQPAALAAALRGKRVGVASLGSAGHLNAEGVLAEHGVPAKEVTFVAIGTGATALAAFKAGAVDALITYEPDLSQVLESGAGKAVLDLRSTRKENTYSHLPTSSLQATSEWIERNPELAAKLVRAVDRANRTLRNDPATSLAALAKVYPAIPPANLKAMYEGSRRQFDSQLTQEQFNLAVGIYLRTRQIKSPVAYERAVATQFRPYWTR